MLKRAMLPQAITLTGVYFGFLAICWAQTDPYRACVCIVMAAVCDMIDGRVARMTGTQSDFGAQLDSLADIVSFGIAPAFLMYKWALSEVGEGVISIGGTLAFLFVGCGAIRLARFNTQAGEENAPSNHFEGLPIPVAALWLTCLVMTAHEQSLELFERWELITAVLIGVSLLMVSRFPFPTYKRFKTRAGMVSFYGTIVTGLSILAAGGPGGTVLFGLLTLYLMIASVGAVTSSAAQRADHPGA
jgi:CDP-diacylglycerol--serine O-phosphatidyltransferase